jgi:uncharacterized protein YgbK (DUF1537 family)
LRAHVSDPASDGLEIVLKGGQMGGKAFFGQVRDGGTGGARCRDDGANL